MIKINLLPFRAARKKENIRQQVTIFALSIILVLVILVVFQGSLSGKIKDLNKDISKTREQITIFKAKADKVEEIKKQLDTLEKKAERYSGTRP